jgi:hypothetical protein
MGDRYVVGFRDTKDTPPVWLYSHWGGSDRLSEIANAIEKARPRWSDSSYATRIAISSIVGDSWGEETGFGISAGGRDFTYPDYDDVHLVTWSDRTVVVQDIDGTRDLVNFGFEVFLSTIPQRA